MLTERKKLESTRKGLLDKLAEWNAELDNMLRQPNSKTINAIDDWEEYFVGTRELLEDQLIRLRTENKAATIKLGQEANRPGPAVAQIDSHTSS